MSEFQLPDGREPIRFDVGRAAFYESSRTDGGEVRYLFSMIKFLREKRQRLPKEELSAVKKEVAKKIKEKDPNFYKRIGRIGGLNGRKDK